MTAYRPGTLFPAGVGYWKLGPLLTDPLADGTASSDALSVVVLSLPGFGFSGPPPTGGLTRYQVAEVVGSASVDPGGELVIRLRARNGAAPQQRRTHMRII
jgi:hypothetical protein